jgi:hypothetical protein
MGMKEAGAADSGQRQTSRPELEHALLVSSVKCGTL